MDIFNRSALLFGNDTMQRIMQTRVILFGVGGVGSWCAESLIRTGIQHLTIVDFDTIAPSNVNRQLPATSKTIGRLKTEVLRERLLEINPKANITAISDIYDDTTADRYDLDAYDYVVDAIDSIESKMLLIRRACASKARLFSSMGAARKLDPTRVAVAEFWKVKGCPLAASLRRRFRQSHNLPSKKFRCVYSEELIDNKELLIDHHIEDNNLADNNLTEHKELHANGSLVHITAIFGFTLSGLIFQDIAKP